VSALSDPAHPDFLPPRQRLVEQAWRDHPEHERLVELKHERHSDGMSAWQTVWQDDPDDLTWSELVFRPVDPFDGRGPYRLGRWPHQWLDQQEQRWQARLTELDA